jgi:hypothetical protein
MVRRFFPCRLAATPVLFLLLLGSFGRPLAGTEPDHELRFPRALGGPVAVRDAFPLARFRLGPTPTSASTLGAGQSSLRTSIDWSTTHAEHSADFIFDSESRLLELAGAHGLTDGLEASARIGYLWRGGGAFDSTVNGFHDLFGLPDGGRDDSPSDRFLVNGFTRQGFYRELSDGGSVTDLVVGLKQRLSEGDAVCVSLQGDLGIPLAREGFSGESPEGALQVLLDHHGERHGFSCGVGGTVSADTHVDGFEFTRYRLHGFAAFEWIWSARLASVLQVQGANRLLRNVESFPDVSSYVVLATRWRWSERAALEMTLVENLWNQQATSDFGLRLGLTLLFP